MEETNLTNYMPLIDCFDAFAVGQQGYLAGLAVPLGGIATTVVILLGLTVNLCSLQLLGSMKLKGFKWYLGTLTMCDTALLICTLTFYSMQLVAIALQLYHPFLVVLCRFMYGVSITTSVTTTWVTVLIALARYRAVARPLHAHMSVFVVHSRFMCGAAVTASVMFCMPSHFELTTSPCWDEQLELERKQIFPTNLRINPSYMLYYRFILFGAFATVVPFLSLIVFSMMLVYKIQWNDHDILINVSNRRRRQRADQHQVTLLILLVVLKFLGSNLLPLGLNTLEVFTGTDGVQFISNALFNNLVEVSNFLVVLNSATNSLVYFGWSRRLARSGHKSVTTQMTNLSTNNIIYNSDVRPRSRSMNSAASRSYLMLGQLLVNTTTPNTPTTFTENASRAAEHRRIKLSISSCTKYNIGTSPMSVNKFKSSRVELECK